VPIAVMWRVALDPAHSRHVRSVTMTQARARATILTASSPSLRLPTITRLALPAVRIPVRTCRVVDYQDSERLVSERSSLPAHFAQFHPLVQALILVQGDRGRSPSPGPEACAS